MRKQIIQLPLHSERVHAPSTRLSLQTEGETFLEGPPCLKYQQHCFHSWASQYNLSQYTPENKMKAERQQVTDYESNIIYIPGPLKLHLYIHITDLHQVSVSSVREEDTHGPHYKFFTSSPPLPALQIIQYEHHVMLSLNSMHFSVAGYKYLHTRGIVQKG